MTLKTVESGSTTSDKSYYFEEEIIVEEEIIENFSQVSSHFEVASEADGDEHGISHQTHHLLEDFSQVSSYIEVTVADEDEHDIAHQTRHSHEVLPMGKHGKDPPRLARDDSGDSKDSGFDLELGPNSDREVSGVTECVMSTRNGSTLLQSRAFGHSSDLRKCGSAIVAGADTQQDWFRTTHHIDTPILEEPLEDFSQVSSYIEATVTDEDEHDISHQTRHRHEVRPVGRHGKEPPSLARDDSGDSDDSGFELELGPNSDREVSGLTECVMSTRNGSTLLQSRAFGHSSDIRKCGSAIGACADIQQEWFRTTHHIDTPILEEPLEDFSQVSSYIEATVTDEDEHDISHQTRHPHEVLPVGRHGKEPPSLARDDSGDSNASGFDLVLGPNSRLMSAVTMLDFPSERGSAIGVGTDVQQNWLRTNHHIIELPILEDANEDSLGSDENQSGSSSVSMTKQRESRDAKKEAMEPSKSEPKQGKDKISTKPKCDAETESSCKVKDTKPTESDPKSLEESTKKKSNTITDSPRKRNTKELKQDNPKTPDSKKGSKKESKKKEFKRDDCLSPDESKRSEKGIPSTPKSAKGKEKKKTTPGKSSTRLDCNNGKNNSSKKALPMRLPFVEPPRTSDFSVNRSEFKWWSLKSGT